MSLRRFQHISRCLRFDDGNQRDRSDKFGPICVVFDMWEMNLRTLYKPTQFVTIDEQLICCCGRCPFKQYIPAKPNPVGIKEWELADTKTKYVLRVIPYLGKPADGVVQKNLGEKLSYN